MAYLRALTIAGALLAAGCSAPQGPGGDAREEPADLAEAPDVSPSAAPGVAWRYDYDFQLTDEAIARVQEAHASQCEALGIARCRITGLRYSVTENDIVTAMLELKLAPDIARRFGKQATAEVTKANGRLQSTEFSGEDTAPASGSIARAQSELSQRIADIERQLASPSLRSAERAQLQAQLSDLRTQFAAARESQTQVQERLASTPMRFDYYGKGGISGFAGRDPVMDAARSFVSSLVAMITILLQVLAVVLPWAVLLFLLYLLSTSRVGLAVRRFFATRRDRGSDS